MYCKGKPIPKIAENKVQYLHFRHLKFLVIQLLEHPRSPRCTVPWALLGDAGHGFLDTILGRGYKRNAQGLVISKCGAPAQRWHVDSSHLFATLPGLPCHFVTVFCPLYQAHKAPHLFFFGGEIFEVWELWCKKHWKQAIHLLRQADKEDRGKVGMLVIMIYYCKWISLPLYLKKYAICIRVQKEDDTVDGRNPAPVDKYFIPLFEGLYTFQVVQGFFHQQLEWLGSMKYNLGAVLSD